jgi:pimeloyl-ACP methyl ester carboxylesterase
MRGVIFILICVLLALTLGSVALWGWAPDLPREGLIAKYSRSSIDFLAISGATLRVQVSGVDDAAIIILIHGFGASLETWDTWVDALATEFRLVRFDLPGSGLSVDSTHQYDDGRSLQLLLALMAHMDIEKAIFIGNSIGGRIAWQFAARHPERVNKLVLVSPDGFASPGFEYGKQPRIPSLLGLMRYFLPRKLLKVNLAMAYADPKRLSDSSVDRYHELMLAAGNRHAMIARLQQTILEDPAAMLRRIKAPTLIMWGEQDRVIPFTNAADYLRLIPRATLAALPGVGHVPQEESAAQSLAPLLRFLLQ